MSGQSEQAVKQKREFVKALDYIARCPYKGTAVKVELEAQLNRPYGDEDSERECNGCDGRGEVGCEECDETGRVTVATPTGAEDIDCEDCGGRGDVTCNDCDGEGMVESERENWGNRECKEFILGAVSEAARTELIYSKFYNDGSVDSEFTFTLPIRRAHYVLEFINAFTLLAEEIGNDMEVDGAGMHIAILNNPHGEYDQNGFTNQLNHQRARNFKASMTPLLPALFFLASADHNSRGIDYRHPEVNLSDKYAAISGEKGCFEYRVFETCYDKPEAFLDYMIVIAKTLRYYKTTPADTSMKLGRLPVKDDGYGVGRFYYSAKHLQALDRGLKLLKPDYKTIAELKRERNFTLDMKKQRALDQAKIQLWRQEYPALKQRLAYERSRYYHELVARWCEMAQQYGVEIACSHLSAASGREYALRELRHNYGHLYGGCRGYIRSRSQEEISSEWRFEC